MHKPWSERNFIDCCDMTLFVGRQLTSLSIKHDMRILAVYAILAKVIAHELSTWWFGSRFGNDIC